MKPNRFNIIYKSVRVPALDVLEAPATEFGIVALVVVFPKLVGVVGVDTGTEAGLVVVGEDISVGDSYLLINGLKYEDSLGGVLGAATGTEVGIVVV